MRIEEALQRAEYARKPINTGIGPNGRLLIDKWIVIDRRSYNSANPAGFRICYADMVPMMTISFNEALPYIQGRDDWEPYPSRYVVDFRRRSMRFGF